MPFEPADEPPPLPPPPSSSGGSRVTCGHCGRSNLLVPGVAICAHCGRNYYSASAEIASRPAPASAREAKPNFTPVQTTLPFRRACDFCGWQSDPEKNAPYCLKCGKDFPKGGAAGPPPPRLPSLVPPEAPLPPPPLDWRSPRSDPYEDVFSTKRAAAERKARREASQALISIAALRLICGVGGLAVLGAVAGNGPANNLPFAPQLIPVIMIFMIAVSAIHGGLAWWATTEPLYASAVGLAIEGFLLLIDLPFLGANVGAAVARIGIILALVRAVHTAYKARHTM